MSYKYNIIEQLPCNLYVNDELNRKEIQVLGNALDRIQSKIDYLEYEIILTTSKDIGLDRREEVFNIKTNKDKPIDQRKSYLISKYRGNGSVTVELLKSVAESYNNGEVEVVENYAKYTFEIKFIAHGGIPQNLTDLKKAIEDIKPAHLGVTYDFKYMVWDVLDSKNLTRDALDAKKVTWDVYETGIW